MWHISVIGFEPWSGDVIFDKSHTIRMRKSRSQSSKIRNVLSLFIDFHFILFTIFHSVQWTALIPTYFLFFLFRQIVCQYFRSIYNSFEASSRPLFSYEIRSLALPLFISLPPSASHSLLHSLSPSPPLSVSLPPSPPLSLSLPPSPLSLDSPVLSSWDNTYSLAVCWRWWTISWEMNSPLFPFKKNVERNLYNFSFRNYHWVSLLHRTLSWF